MLFFLNVEKVEVERGDAGPQRVERLARRLLHVDKKRRGKLTSSERLPRELREASRAALGSDESGDLRRQSVRHGLDARRWNADSSWEAE